MAFFVPMLTAVGGGSAVAGGITLASAAAGVYGGVQQHRAGQIAEAEHKLQSKQEGDAARGREIERKRALLSSLSSQHARAGAQGVAVQGSNAAIMQRDIKDNRQDLLYDTANTRGRQRILRSRGGNAARQGSVNAIMSIADTALNTYQAAG